MVEAEGMPAWYRRIRILVVIAAAVVAAGVAQPAHSMGETGAAGQSSSKVHHRRSHSHQHSRRAAPVVMYHAALLEDADTGRILYADNPNLVWPPASMAKMMLLLVASDQIAAGRVSFNTPVRISELSAMTHGSRLGLHEGEVYPLGELMKAALIKSANDAAVAVAEAVGGSVEGAVRLMNAKAQSLGMTNTEYQTVDGLPPTPDHDVDRTSPLDLATVARALIHTTNLLQWSGMETALFDGSVVLHNTNHLIGRYEGCDGLKTGFTMQAGFNLTATARRHAVAFGHPGGPFEPGALYPDPKTARLRLRQFRQSRVTQARRSATGSCAGGPGTGDPAGGGVRPGVGAAQERGGRRETGIQRAADGQWTGCAGCATRSGYRARRRDRDDPGGSDIASSCRHNSDFEQCTVAAG